MRKCELCKKTSPFISKIINICGDCVRKNFDIVKDKFFEIHRTLRRKDGLPEEIPLDPKGRKCRICLNGCSIPEGEMGFCGVYENRNGKLVPKSGDWKKAYVYWYYDPLPTNCCATWVCPGKKEYGFYNLAVFYCSCNFDCLFCQNWIFRRKMNLTSLNTVEDLLEAVNDKVKCICFFGGDPIPQVVHALIFAKRALERYKVRICWETNGAVSKPLLAQMAKLSLESGGCIKVDLKCWTKEMSFFLSGVSNKGQKENFKYLVKFHRLRPDPPFLIASTLLVPGYVDMVEVEGIARFIASLDPSIPWTLLGFHPDFYLSDLPPTPRNYAFSCLEIAKNAGIKELHIGNIHLLS